MQPTSMSTRRRNRTHTAKPCASFLIWLCVAMLLAVTGGAPALAQDTFSATPEAAVTETAPIPEAPAVSETLLQPMVQEPTAEPVIAQPTAEPIMEPTPTLVPLEPSPTPTIEAIPTATAEIVTSPTPSVVAAPSPTVAPTSATASRTTSFAATSVEVGNGAITGCTGKGPDILSPSGSLIVECFVAESGKVSADFTLGSLTSTAPGATTGWSAQLAAAGKSTGFITGGATLSVRAQMPSFTIELRAPQTGGVPGAIVSIDLSVKICNNGGNSCNNGSTTVSAILQPGFDPSRVTMTCDPQPVAITRLQQGVVNCSVSVPADAAAAVGVAESVRLSVAAGRMELRHVAARNGKRRWNDDDPAGGHIGGWRIMVVQRHVVAGVRR